MTNDKSLLLIFAQTTESIITCDDEAVDAEIY